MFFYHIEKLIVCTNREKEGLGDVINTFSSGDIDNTPLGFRMQFRVNFTGFIFH